MALAISGIAASPAAAIPYYGEVMMTAAGYCPGPQSRSGGTMPADGRLLPIQSFMIVFALIGPRFGGDGQRSFALPALTGPAWEGGYDDGPRPIDWCVYNGAVFPAGDGRLQEDGRARGDFLATAARGCPPGWTEVTDPGLPAQGTLMWCKAGQSSPTIDPREIGRIIVAADACPDGTMPTDGRLMNLANGSDSLFSLIGASFGGDGVRTYGIPQLTDPGPGLKFCIVTNGAFPERP